MYAVHESVVQEMVNRGYNHKSPLDKKLAKGKRVQNEFVDPVKRQIEILKQKGCSCDVIELGCPTKW